jgi:hypothetical protein
LLQHRKPDHSVIAMQDERTVEVRSSAMLAPPASLKGWSFQGAM